MKDRTTESAFRTHWRIFAVVTALAATLLPGAPRAQTTLFQEPELTVAADEGDIERVKGLLARGTNTDVYDSKKHTALIYAAIGGHIDIAGLLLDAGAGPNVVDSLGNTPLAWAASQGEYDIARMLMDAGADPDQQNKQGLTALMLAASRSRADVVGLLIDAGADLSLLDYTGRGPLGWARTGRDPRIVQALQRAGARD